MSTKRVLTRKLYAYRHSKKIKGEIVIRRNKLPPTHLATVGHPAAPPARSCRVRTTHFARHRHLWNLLRRIIALTETDRQTDRHRDRQTDTETDTDPQKSTKRYRGTQRNIQIQR